MRRMSRAVPLGLADPAAERGELVAATHPAEVVVRLAGADHRPLDVAERLPVADPVAVDRRTAGRLVGGDELVQLARRPATGRSSLPKRQERMQSQPMSSAGSPRWASSQSITAARPSSSTMKLPSRKSPCTSRGSAGSGAFARSQRSPSSTAGSGSPISSSWRSHSAIWSSAGIALRRAAATPSTLDRVDRVDSRPAPSAELGGQARHGRARTRACAGCAGRPRSRRRSAISMPAVTEAAAVRLEGERLGDRNTGLAAHGESGRTRRSIGTSETDPSGSRRRTQRRWSRRASTNQVSREAPPGIGAQMRSRRDRLRLRRSRSGRFRGSAQTPRAEPNRASIVAFAPHMRS